MDIGTRWATIQGLTKSQTRLSMHTWMHKESHWYNLLDYSEILNLYHLLEKGKEKYLRDCY